MQGISEEALDQVTCATLRALGSALLPQPSTSSTVLYTKLRVASLLVEGMNHIELMA
jgi:hypothetical protein